MFKNTKGIIVNKKQYNLLKQIYLNKDKHISFFMRFGYTGTSSWLFSLTNEFQKRGLIEFEKMGRIKKVRITKKGIELIKHLSVAYSLINGDDEYD